MFLFLKDEKGSLVPTKNQLQIDCHFELPRGKFISYVINPGHMCSKGLSISLSI